MPEQFSFNRNLYKSIVVGMSICIPLGIWLGIALGNIVLGLTAGNSLGILLGMGINSWKLNKERS